MSRRGILGVLGVWAVIGAVIGALSYAFATWPRETVAVMCVLTAMTVVGSMSFFLYKVFE